MKSIELALSMCDIVDIYGFTVDPGYTEWSVYFVYLLLPCLQLTQPNSINDAIKLCKAIEQEAGPGEWGGTLIHPIHFKTS